MSRPCEKQFKNRIVKKYVETKSAELSIEGEYISEGEMGKRSWSETPGSFSCVTAVFFFMVEPYGGVGAVVGAGRVRGAFGVYLGDELGPFLRVSCQLN